ncbi:hypothetical protein [Clostridium lundense]|uniref:hypothetical protein n=1 Tax=Clostridium lundense TaxID=319475 RepID=UPI000A912E2D|nr:hypothetical protein [Clostridium lundense]
MFINIIRTEDNINFIEPKSYSIFTDNDDGTVSVQQNVCAISDRIWIDEEFPFNTGQEYIYKIKLPNNISLEGYIFEKGNDDYGHYILFLNFNASIYLHDNEKRPNIPCGKVEINLILSPDMIEGSDKLIKNFHGTWPSFHEANIRIIEKSTESMTLEFHDGFLFDKVVRLIITGIISESYDKDSIESFNDRCLTNVQFRKVESNMKILLFDDYIIESLPEDFDTSVFDDPEFDTDTIRHLYITEEHKNHGVIVCKSLKIVVTINEDKKKQLEEDYKEFLDECQHSVQ